MPIEARSSLPSNNALPNAVSQCCFEYLRERWSPLYAKWFAEFGSVIVASWVAPLLSLRVSEAVANSVD